MEFIIFIVSAFVIMVIYSVFNMDKVNEIVSIINMSFANQSNQTKNAQTKDSTLKHRWNRNIHHPLTSKFSEKGTKGHTARIWRKKGYKLKAGETYSYKYYGNEVYTKNQVEKLSKLESKKNFNKSYDYDDRKEDYEDRRWQKEIADIIGRDESWK